jgi:signal transduction histidine kinase
MMIEFHAVHEVVAKMEADLPDTHGVARVKLLLNLAWALRQSDARRAVALADQVQQQLAGADFSGAERESIAMRLMLINADARWLFGEIQASKTLAQTAWHGFAQIGDSIGCADAHWAVAWAAYGLGEVQERDAAFEAMVTCAKADPVRHTVALAMLERHKSWIDGESVKLQFANVDQHPAAAGWVDDVLAIAASQRSDYIDAILHWRKVWLSAQTCCHPRLAILSACSIGLAFNNLNEYHTALEWMHRGLDLARQVGSPGLTGIALTQTAETLRRLQRFDVAQEMLTEALGMMAPLSGLRGYTNAMRYLAEGELDRHKYDSALKSFQALEQHVIKQKQLDLLSIARRGQAHALFELGQTNAALEAAHAALVEAPIKTSEQIAALRVLAEIYERYPLLPPPEGVQAASVALHYLNLAMQLAESITDYTISGDVFDAVAHEYEKLGDFQQAYRYAQKAWNVREKTNNQEANNRAWAIQLSHQTERAEIEDAHQRELASEAKRAEILQQTSATLEQLGIIGQEITAHLEGERVFEVLTRRVRNMLDVDLLAIYLIDDNGTTMSLCFGSMPGSTEIYSAIKLDDEMLDAPRCVRERREILVELEAESLDPRWLLPGKPTLSRLFAPLVIEDQVLGVITVQSYQPHAYGAREQMVFRTLNAYTAIALSNASVHGELAKAHKQLQETQQQLLLQGKMAGLGTLTAGVAHEINNPTNFAHVAAQNLRLDIAEFEQFVNSIVDVDAEHEIVTAFQQRFGRLDNSVTIMLHGTERIKGIVKDLRAFTRLDEAEKKEVYLSECLHSTLNLVRTSWLEKVEFIVEFNDEPAIECWPALLNQVFMNLLVNGCQAIEEKATLKGETNPERGKLWCRLKTDPANQRVVISFEDSGVGIDAQAQTRILEPFYTTKAVGVGTGLGLSIAFGIIQKHGGSLEVSSVPGVGSCFTIYLPLAANKNEKVADGD